MFDIHSFSFDISFSFYNKVDEHVVVEVGADKMDEHMVKVQGLEEKCNENIQREVG